MTQIEELEIRYPDLKFIAKPNCPDGWGATLINNTVYYNPFYPDIFSWLHEEAFHAIDIPDGVDITKQVDRYERRAETKARIFSFQQIIPYDALDGYYAAHPYDDDQQVADFFGVSLSFLTDAVNHYKITNKA